MNMTAPQGRGPDYGTTGLRDYASRPVVSCPVVHRVSNALSCVAARNSRSARSCAFCRMRSGLNISKNKRERHVRCCAFGIVRAARKRWGGKMGEGRGQRAEGRIRPPISDLCPLATISGLRSPTSDHRPLFPARRP